MRVLIFLVAMVGCNGGDTDEEDIVPVASGDSCASLAECGDGEVCIATGTSAEGSCELDCTVTGNECEASVSCEPVGLIDVSICQGLPATDADPEESAIHVPCAADADCADVGADAVCAEWEGTKGCTTTCADEAACDMGEMFGFGVDFLTCGADASDATRSVCIPDPACVADPLTCVDLSGS